MIVDCVHPLREQCELWSKSAVFNHTGDAECWIAGGCIRDWWSTRKVGSDIDVWFPDDRNLGIASDAAKSNGWFITKETNASINWSTKSKLWVQFIKKHFFASIDETLSAFDFTVCCAGITRHGEMKWHQDFAADLAAKRLAISKMTYPLSTWRRCLKYAEKGFKLCPDQERIILSALKGELESMTIEDANRRYME